MKEFLSRHSYLVIWILSLIIIGSVAMLIIKLNGIIPASPARNPNGGAANPEATAPQTSVTTSIEKSASGNSFVVHWKNLPNGTVALEIFRGKTGTDPSTWLLWKTVSISQNNLADGNASINIGNETEDGYSFYEEAVTGSGTNASDTTPLWTSSPTSPTQPDTNPPPQPQSPNPPDDNQPPPQNNPNNSTTTPTSSPVSNPNPQNNPPSNPTGTPYYSPEVQISGYGSPQSGNFWVQHVDQKIQIGWQNLLPSTTQMIVTRSTNQNGPWTTVLIQKNPGTAGPYSLQIVDDTLGQSYYYEMETEDSSGATTAVYGPTYLPSSYSGQGTN